VELYDEEYRSLDQLLALVDGIDSETVREVCAAFFAPELQTIESLGPRAAI
jgi:predicted Zn-dependent peptidase